MGQKASGFQRDRKRDIGGACPVPLKGSTRLIKKQGRYRTAAIYIIIAPKEKYIKRGGEFLFQFGGGPGQENKLLTIKNSQKLKARNLIGGPVKYWVKVYKAWQ